MRFEHIKIFLCYEYVSFIFCTYMSTLHDMVEQQILVFWSAMGIHLLSYILSMDNEVSDDAQARLSLG